MTHEQFSFWLEGYLAAGGADTTVIREKLSQVHSLSVRPPLGMQIRGGTLGGGIQPAQRFQSEPAFALLKANDMVCG